ncbi:hypothetical protein [Nocardia sp. GTS18]|uniref:hypothetical protein n=1 Tax=Nocardia sp. GTS18 TaxID=1778064 RepID=UPI0015EF849D|nr:hypothetical protein [Nocardia sp. GTS18]
MVDSLEWRSPLEVHWLCDQELIGSDMQTTISGYPVVVHFPHDIAGRDADRMLQNPPQLIGQVPYQDWGIARAALQVAIIMRLGFTAIVPTGSKSEMMKTEILNSLDAWLDIAIDWLSVLTGTHTRNVGPQFDLAFENRTMMFDISNCVPTFSPGFRPIPFPSSLPGKIATKEAVRYCFERAASGDPVPLAWSLISEARALHRARQYRRAVVDAGSAAEMAAYALVQLEFASKTPPGVAKLLVESRGNLTLGTLVGYLKATDYSLPANIFDDLVTIRNKVLHSNKGAGPVLPTESESVTAIEIATKIVKGAYPLAAGTPLLW